MAACSNKAKQPLVKILIITYSYTPDLTPRAFRWSAVAAQLAERGHDVHVLCAGLPSRETTAVGTPVKVHRVKDWFLNASARVKPSAAAAAPGAPNGRSSSSWRSMVRKGIRAIWRSSYWPDYACGWVVPGALAARALCVRHRFDWVISVSHPFTGHLVGWLAMQRARPARWLVDIGDPFSLMEEPSPNNPSLYTRLNQFVERRVIGNAQAISVTTDATRRLYETHFPLSAAKMRVIPPLLSLPAPPLAAVRNPTAPVRLVFVGTLYKRLRSPRYLLQCFTAVTHAFPDRRLELHFYGSVNDCADELAAFPASGASGVHVHGLVDRQTVFQAMVDADVLVNIGNASESQLASKVIEYMATGKPVLNFTSIAKDTSVEALADYTGALTIPCTPGVAPTPATVDALCRFIAHPPPLDPAAADRVRQAYSAPKVSSMYAALLAGDTA